MKIVLQVHICCSRTSDNRSWNVNWGKLEKKEWRTWLLWWHFCVCHSSGTFIAKHGDKIPDCMDMVNQKVFRHKLNCECRSVIMALLTEMVSVKCYSWQLEKWWQILKLAVRKMAEKNMNGCVMLNWDDFSKGRFGLLSWTYIPKKLWIFTWLCTCVKLVW